MVNMAEKNYSGEYVLAFVKRTVSEYARRRFPRFLTTQDREDAASLAFDKIYSSGVALDPGNNPDGYLYKASVGAVNEWALKKARYLRVVTGFEGYKGDAWEEGDGYEEYPDYMPELGAGTDMPDARLIARETAEEISDSLSERNARVMDLRIQGYESGEIAERLGMSPSAAYMAVHHVKEHAKKVG